MKIQRQNAQRPLRKLRKALKLLPEDPSAANVHTLRTQTRRLEAIADALMLEDKKRTRQVLKAVNPVRKAAGDVRDMDVLVENVLALARDRKNEALARLMEHLGERRVEGARELKQAASTSAKAARRSLKGYTKLVSKQFPGKREIVAKKTPAPGRLAAELAKWPRLNEENIHSFRIKVKQLRYMLQLSGGADPKIVSALGKVKDDVGDWHDWQELALIARKVLDPKTDKTALKEITEIGDKKYKQALSAANEIRSGYLSSGQGSGGLADDDSMKSESTSKKKKRAKSKAAKLKPKAKR